MTGAQKKYLAVAGGLAAVVATALMSMVPGNPTVHTVCEIVLKVLAVAGFTAPISIMNPTNPDGSDKKS